MYRTKRIILYYVKKSVLLGSINLLRPQFLRNIRSPIFLFIPPPSSFLLRSRCKVNWRSAVTRFTWVLIKRLATLARLNAYEITGLCGIFEAIVTRFMLGRGKMLGRIQILKIVNSPFLISHRDRSRNGPRSFIRYIYFSTNITPSRLARLPMEKSFLAIVNVPSDGWDALEVYSPGYGSSVRSVILTCRWTLQCNFDNNATLPLNGGRTLERKKIYKEACFLSLAWKILDRG